MLYNYFEPQVWAHSLITRLPNDQGDWIINFEALSILYFGAFSKISVKSIVAIWSYRVIDCGALSTISNFVLKAILHFLKRFTPNKCYIFPRFFKLIFENNNLRGKLWYQNKWQKLNTAFSLKYSNYRSAIGNYFFKYNYFSYIYF